MSEDTFIQLKNGCPTAFADIHAKYSRNIFWVGKRLIDDEFVIESLVQDAFLKLWTHRDTVESPKHIFFFFAICDEKGMHILLHPTQKQVFQKHPFAGTVRKLSGLYGGL